MSFKYVVLRVGNREVPVIFPSTMVHTSMAGLVKAYFAQEAQQLSDGMLSEAALGGIIKGIKTVSAGEITFDVGRCSGSSETLGLQSRGSVDEALIKSFPYRFGMLDD